MTKDTINKRGVLNLKMREQDRHFLWSLLAAIGVIFIWKGLWEGLYEIPYFGEPWVALFVGLAMLTFSGIIFREFDPLGGIEKSTNKVIKDIVRSSNRKNFKIIYHDNVRKKDILISGDKIKSIEKSAIIIKEKNKEHFIPTHRLKEVLHKGKTYWKM